MGSQIFFLSAINMLDDRSLLLSKFPKAKGLQHCRVGGKSLS